MFRVALVRAFSQSEYKEPAEPLGIEALAAYLRLHKIECQLFDREIESFYAVTDRIIEYAPTLIGFSVMMEDNVPDALKMLLRIRSLRPDTDFVAGGLFVTTNYERAQALFPAGCKLIIGEGEVPLLNICYEAMGKSVLQAAHTGLTPQEWPWMYRPNLETYLQIGAPINIRSSRGCPGQCRFCATPFLPAGLDKWVGRKIVDVADEMEELCAHYSPHAFNFIDDDFGSLQRVEELQSELEKRNLRCALSLQLRALTICSSKNLYDTMKRLKKRGLCRVFIGLESFDQETLAYFNKKLDPDKTLEAFQIIRNAGIAIHIGYILWHPLSTIASVKAEAQRLWDNHFFTTKIVMAKLQLFPGCGLTKEGETQIRMSAEVENYFAIVAKKIAPLYDSWLVGAIDVPRQYCMMYLEESEENKKRVMDIEQELNRLDALAFKVLMNPGEVSGEEISSTAREVKERLHEFGCTFDQRK